jgi:hypothetical protein
MKNGKEKFKKEFTIIQEGHDYERDTKARLIITCNPLGWAILSDYSFRSFDSVPIYLDKADLNNK